MKLLPAFVAFGALCSALAQPLPGDPTVLPETDAQHGARMAWWRDARFGLFIHWGLYAIPAGEWQGSTTHAEWIRHTAQIPIEEYDRFVEQFNPVKFNADDWVRLAQDAGMKYIVITSKHHDGFCLFDSQYTDYDAMSTPFKRDVLKDLAAACARGGIRLCFYHSIMDWHHPDYLPRRGWETRTAEGADYDRYVTHLKNQLRELCTNYGPIGVLWFDGEWESTWTHARGVDLYNYVRNLRPDIIINNRVDNGRDGMAGMNKDARFPGDFGTPEQEIPATGVPGMDWETCMTMNNNWGYNKFDQNWKSPEDLIRKLADIASKGGNFLLNIGPTAEGEFPPPAIERLKTIGQWMHVNSEAIYGTQASPFRTLPWGRCTQKKLDGGQTRLYLHVFDWPGDGRLVVSGLYNEPRQAYGLASGPTEKFPVQRVDDALVLTVPTQAPDPIDSLIVLDITGRPDVAVPPAITAECDIFIDALDVRVASDRENVELRYTTDGSNPNSDAKLVTGPITIHETTTIKARAFRAGQPVSGTSDATFTKVVPRPADRLSGANPGLDYAYYEGDWDKLPDFDQLKPVKVGATPNFDLSLRGQDDFFAFRFSGFVTVPRSGVYRFSTLSDDGSRLYIGNRLVVDNDGLHGMKEAVGVIALEPGPHPLTVTFFEKAGNEGLQVWYSGPQLEKQALPSAVLSFTQTEPGGAPVDQR